MRERSQTDLGVERYLWAKERLSPASLVADAGCGLGYGAKILAGPGRTVIGFDISREAIEHANVHYPGFPRVVCNIELQTFSGFDALVSLETLSHLVDPYAWVKNLDVPLIVISAPTLPSKHFYPWRKHDIPIDQLMDMFSPRWNIIDTLRQGVSPEEGYLVIHGRRTGA